MQRARVHTLGIQMEPVSHDRLHIESHLAFQGGSSPVSKTDLANVSYGGERTCESRTFDAISGKRKPVPSLANWRPFPLFNSMGSSWAGRRPVGRPCRHPRPSPRHHGSDDPTEKMSIAATQSRFLYLEGYRIQCSTLKSRRFTYRGLKLHIVILKGQSQYEGTRTFADQAAAAFLRRGFSVHVEDLTRANDISGTIVATSETQNADLVFSINIMGEFRDNSGRSVSDLFAAPHVVWHTDYILSQRDRLEGTPSSTALLLVDPTQIDTVRSLYGPDRFPHMHFFPHAAVGLEAPSDADSTAFEAARPIRVLWSGSLQQPGNTPWDTAPPQTRKVFSDAVDLALSVEWMPPLQALDTVLTALGMDVADPANLGARSAAAFIDVEVRKTRRFEFLKAVAKTKIPVTICGVNWESQLYRFKKANYEGAVPMTRMADLMQQSRIVLNTNGNFGAGSHERPFSALLAGAACFSDTSIFYQSEFDDGADIALFKWKDLKGGMDKLVALNSDSELCRRIASNGQKKVVERHTWDKRIEAIITAGQSVTKRLA